MECHTCKKAHDDSAMSPLAGASRAFRSSRCPSDSCSLVSRQECVIKLLSMYRKTGRPCIGPAICLTLPCPSFSVSRHAVTLEGLQEEAHSSFRC